MDRSSGAPWLLDGAVAPTIAVGAADPLAGMRAVFAVSSEALALFDGDGRVSLTNRRFEELLQLPAEYVVGKRLAALHADLARLFVDPAAVVSGLRGPGGARRQWTAAQRWPEERQLQFRFAAIAGAGARAGVLAVQPLGADGEGARLREHFIALTARELRSPLASIVGFVDLLRTDAAPNLTEMQREYLGFVHSDALHERDVIEQLLELLTIDAGHNVLQRGEVALGLLLRRAALELRPRLTESEQRLVLEGPQDLPRLTGDAERLQRALQAVLTHAQDRTSLGGVLRVQVRQEPRRVCITVLDDGPPLTDEEDQWLQSHLRRAALPDSPPEGGLALGLLLAQTIMHLHGGTLEVSNAPDAGVQYVLALPCDAEARD